MTKIDLITGILGSGKTTFIIGYAQYLMSRGENIAVLENDFGAVNVDMLMLQELKEKGCHLEMVLGGGDHDCHKRRFKTQLISLGMQHFDRIVIEPSGIFDMDEFFDMIHESPLDNWFTVGNIITVIDASREADISSQMEYLFASEAAYSGKLVLSKTEYLKGEDITAASERVLEHLNRSLEAIRCDRRFAPSDVLPHGLSALTPEDHEILTKAGYRGAAYVKKYHPDDIQSNVHYFMNITIGSSRADELLRGIFTDAECGRIYRIKGAVRTQEGGWLKINSTPEKLEIQPISEGQAVLIVIGDNVKLSAVSRHIEPLNSDTDYTAI